MARTATSLPHIGMVAYFSCTTSIAFPLFTVIFFLLALPLSLAPIANIRHQVTRRAMDERIFNQLDQLERGARETRSFYDYSVNQSYDDHEIYNDNEQAMQLDSFGESHRPTWCSQANMQRPAPPSATRLPATPPASRTWARQTVSTSYWTQCAPARHAAAKPTGICNADDPLLFQRSPVELLSSPSAAACQPKLYCQQTPPSWFWRRTTFHA